MMESTGRRVVENIRLVSSPCQQLEKLPHSVVSYLFSLIFRVFCSRLSYLTAASVGRTDVLFNLKIPNMYYIGGLL